MRATGLMALALLMAMPLGHAESAQATRWPFPSPYDMFYGKTPDRRVKNWIRLILLTPRNSPVPAFFISPELIGEDPTRILVHLSKHQYELLDRLTRASRCSETSGNFLPSQVLQVAEHAGGKTHIVCQMTLPAACRYLAGIETIPGIGWEEPKWDFMRGLPSSLGCT